MTTENFIILNFNPIGSLVIYTVQPIGASTPVFTNNIYWSDKGNPSGYGPFTTVYYAVEHYKQTVMSRKDFTLQLSVIEGGIIPLSNSNVISLANYKANRPIKQ